MPELNFFDDTKRNGYPIDIMKKILAKKIMESPAHIVRLLTPTLLGREAELNHFVDDASIAITFSKNNDPVEKYLAKTMLRKLWNNEEL
jgi:hypothetical protein